MRYNSCSDSDTSSTFCEVLSCMELTVEVAWPAPCMLCAPVCV